MRFWRIEMNGQLLLPRFESRESRESRRLLLLRWKNRMNGRLLLLRWKNLRPLLLHFCVLLSADRCVFPCVCWCVSPEQQRRCLREKKKGNFCKVQTIFISTYLSWVEKFSKSEFLLSPHVFTLRVSKVKWSQAKKWQKQLLKQLICYASNTQPSLLEWPLFLMIKGDQFKKDSFSVKNMWGRKTILSWPECTREKWEGEPWQNGIFKADRAGHW